MARSMAANGRRPGPAAYPRRPSRLRLWLKRRRNLLRPAGLSILGFGLLGAAGAALYLADPAGRAAALVENVAQIGHAAGLEVQEVRIEGHRNAPLDLVRSAIGAYRGDAILEFSPEEARARLEQIAWVEGAHVERRLPGTILVRLTERQPFAIWQHQGRFAVIDRGGKVVTTEMLDAFGPLPLVVGAGADRAAGNLVDLLMAHPDLVARTQALVRVGERRWNLRLHNGADVLLPEGQEAPALQRLSELQARNALLDRPIVMVDMRMPDRLVVRQQPQPEQAAPATPPRRSGNTRG